MMQASKSPSRSSSHQPCRKETVDGKHWRNGHPVRSSFCDVPKPMVEYAFQVLEADVDANSLKDVVATLPNKTRLTPLSIMVCNTISAVQSQTLLKVLFDSGLTAMFISCKGLPRHCKPCPVTKTHVLTCWPDCALPIRWWFCMQYDCQN